MPRDVVWKDVVWEGVVPGQGRWRLLADGWQCQTSTGWCNAGGASAFVVAAHVARINADLLAALRTYVRYDEFINGPAGDPDTDRLQVARAAIAKAEGST